MSTRFGLALSSIVTGSLLTLAAAPAMASILSTAQDIADNLTPANNSWGTPCNISLTAPYTATTNGACFFTLVLQRDDPTITTGTIFTWWGFNNPGSPAYYDAIAAGNHFTEITNVADIQAGDLLAVKYQTSSTSPYTGYLMIVEYEPELVTGSNTRYTVGIIDSTQTPHGSTDTRYLADTGANGPEHDKGIGSGDIYIDADATGAIAGHTWSAGPGSFYSQVARSMKVGRFFP